MIHWFAYTIMQTARSLWGKALPVAEGRSLLATDYDAIYSLERYPAGSGWKEEKITDVSIRANRHAIYRDEQGRTKARLPGIPSWDTAQRTIGGGA